MAVVEKVELGFDENGPGPFFVLDDPIAGILDNTAYVLAGPYFQDVSAYIVSISTNRGKSRSLDRYQSGHVNIVFNNRNRYFDPTYTGSPFYGQIVPRRDVRVWANNVMVFYGTVDDWNLDYAPNGESSASLSAYDGFAFLAQQTLTAQTFPSELSGARVNRVLNDAGVAWSTTSRAIDVGQEVLQGDTVTAANNALQYLQLVETTEPGNLFIDKSGNITFKDRASVAPSSSAPVLSDDNSGIQYAQVKVIYGSELLFNQVEFTRNGSTTVVQANDTASQTVYGVRTLSDQSLLNNSDAALADLAVFTVGLYAQPEYRFDQVELILSKLGTTDQNTILGLELGSVCKVVFTPNGIGSQIVKYGAVISISHQVDLTQHRVVIGLGTLSTSVFVLDDVAFGILDTNQLGF